MPSQLTCELYQELQLKHWLDAARSLVIFVEPNGNAHASADYQAFLRIPRITYEPKVFS